MKTKHKKSRRMSGGYDEYGQYSQLPPPPTTAPSYEQPAPQYSEQTSMSTPKKGWLSGLWPSSSSATTPDYSAAPSSGTTASSWKFWGGKRRRSRMMGGRHHPSGTSRNPITVSSSSHHNPAGSRTKRKFRGGFHGYTPTTGMASTAASFSGVTAKAHNYVGGKKRGRKSRKHRMR